MVTHAVGVGPLRSPESRDQTRAAFALADRATVRDRASLQLLTELGVENVRLGADPVFLHTIEDRHRREADEVLGSLGITAGEPFLAVQLRFWDAGAGANAWHGEIAAAVDRFLAEHPGRVVFLPFQGIAEEYGDDTAVAHAVRERMARRQDAVVVPQLVPAPLVAAVIERATLTLGMRYHACLLSFVAGTRPVALAYDPKVRSLCEEMGQPEAMLTPDHWRADDVFTALSRAAVAGPLPPEPSAAMRRRAREGPGTCLELLADPPRRSESEAQRRLRRLALDKTHALLAAERKRHDQLATVEAERERLQRELDPRDQELRQVHDQLSWQRWRSAELEARVGPMTAQMNETRAFLEHMRASRRYRLSALLAELRSAPLAAGRSLARWLTNGHAPLAGADDYLMMAKQKLTLPAPLGQVMIFAVVPFDDVGGGQRSAQLTRALLRRGYRVTYLYAYPRADVAGGRQLPSPVEVPHLDHRHLDAASPEEILAIDPATTVLFEIPHPSFLPFARAAWSRGLRTVFELIDDWQAEGVWAPWLDAAVQQEFIDRSSVCVGTARLLVDRLRELGGQPQYVPNAADEQVFNAYAKYSRPGDYPEGYASSLLYFGSLYGEWFDWDYLRAAAERSPEKAFVLIGDDAGNEPVPPNIIRLGPKPNAELPAYLAQAEAGFLPRPGALSRGMSPVKVNEYLFLNKPVIATPMPELDEVPNVHQAASPEAFASLCASVPPFTGSGESFVSRNTWDSRIDALLDLPAPERRYSIVVVMHNNRTIIGRLLETLLFHTRDLDVEVIVVDNASRDGSAERVAQEFPQVVLRHNCRNNSSSGRNLGVDAATGDVLMFLDSDQWLTSRGWIYEAEHLFAHYPEIGAVGWTAGWFEPSRGHFGGPVIDDLPDRGRHCPEMAYRGFRTDVAYLATAGMLVPRRVWERLDGFDEAYDPVWFEDTDLSFQILAAGFQLAYRDLSGIRHQAHQTTDAHPDSMAIFRRNSEYFGKKWKDYPQFFRELG